MPWQPERTHADLINKVPFTCAGEAGGSGSAAAPPKGGRTEVFLHVSILAWPHVRRNLFLEVKWWSCGGGRCLQLSRCPQLGNSSILGVRGANGGLIKEIIFQKQRAVSDRDETPKEGTDRCWESSEAVFISVGGNDTFSMC